jgi:hypothetical protein
MPETMKVTQEPDFGPRAMRVHGSLLVLALLAFAVGWDIRPCRSRFSLGPRAVRSPPRRRVGKGRVGERYLGQQLF